MLPFSKCHLSRQTSRIDSAPACSVSCSFSLSFSFHTQQQGRGENNAKKGHCPSPSSTFLLIISANLPHIAYYRETEKQCERDKEMETRRNWPHVTTENHTGFWARICKILVKPFCISTDFRPEQWNNGVCTITFPQINTAHHGPCFQFLWVFTMSFDSDAKSNAKSNYPNLPSYSASDSAITS